MFACFKILARRPTPISVLPCLFGIVRTRDSRDIKRCFPPEYGQSNQSFFSRETKLLHEIGFNCGITKHLYHRIEWMGLPWMFVLL